MPRPDPVIPSSSERRVVVVTADYEMGRELQRLCGQLGHRSTLVSDVHRLREVILPGSVDVVLLDVEQLGNEPRDVLRLASPAEDGPAVVLIADSADPHRAYDLLSEGATDVIHRPPHSGELSLRIARAVEARDLGLHLASLEDEITERSRRSFMDRIVVARSPAMRSLADTIERVARMKTTVLVTGESGVGKELVARTIHFRSPRLDGPFIALNCAALPHHLIESELFGHERGAFTGAISRRAGKFELAHRGTLFLDEIGETDPSTQAKLLRVLEVQEFMRVGGSHPVRVDVRLVAATNADLERLVAEGRFRGDLLYRLKVVTLRVPPLRERREDIPDLVETFLLQICRDNHLRPRQLTPEAFDALCRYPWPGNVRELLNALEAVVVASPGETIGLEHLPPNIQAGGVAPAGRAVPANGPSLRELEAETIRATLQAVGGSRTRAARMLGIGVRTLRRHVQRLGLDREHPPRPGRPRRRPSSSS
ncbi:MAG: sigma-54-dependent Fis family transcriptional regulator [Acidobacteria bacterium]|nr:sigma-54-dependent Fis family transcriptional regulator [Acidobacteriota bacterium]